MMGFAASGVESLTPARTFVANYSEILLPVRSKTVKFIFARGFTRRALSWCTDENFRTVYRKVSHVKMELESGSRSSMLGGFRTGRGWTAGKGLHWFWCGWLKVVWNNCGNERRIVEGV